MYKDGPCGGIVLVRRSQVVQMYERLGNLISLEFWTHDGVNKVFLETLLFEKNQRITTNIIGLNFMNAACLTLYRRSLWTGLFVVRSLTIGEIFHVELQYGPVLFAVIVHSVGEGFVRSVAILSLHQHKARLQLCSFLCQKTTLHEDCV